MEFKVSVIIPVYNSASFLKESVASAVDLSEVGEVLLVDDGSTDNSIEICHDLAKESHRIKVLRHPDEKNHGVSATRNLGIKSAAFEYIAFLDADDLYLKDRFTKTKEVFATDRSVDGVYDAAQYEEDYVARNTKLYTVSESIDPPDLFFWLLSGRKGFFCTDTITVKRSLLEKTGLFLESIRIAEDSELWLRLAYYGKIASGELTKAVAVIRRHTANAKQGRNQKTLQHFYEILLEYYSDKHLSYHQKRGLLSGYWRSRSLKFTNSTVRRIFYYFYFFCSLLRLGLTKI